jgi:hypothetical protein
MPRYGALEKETKEASKLSPSSCSSAPGSDGIGPGTSGLTKTLSRSGEALSGA